MPLQEFALRAPFHGFSPDLGWTGQPWNRMPLGYGVRVWDGRLAPFRDRDTTEADIGKAICYLGPVTIEPGTAYNIMAVVMNDSNVGELWYYDDPTWTKASGAYTFTIDANQYTRPTFINWYDTADADAYVLVCPAHIAAGSTQELVKWNAAGGAAAIHTDGPNRTAAICQHNNRVVVWVDDTLKWSKVGDAISASSWPAANVLRPGSAGERGIALWNLGSSFLAVTGENTYVCFDTGTSDGIVVQQRLSGFGVQYATCVTGQGTNSPAYLAMPNGSIARYDGASMSVIATAANEWRQRFNAVTACALEPYANMIVVATGNANAGGTNNHEYPALFLDLETLQWSTPGRSLAASQPHIAVGVQSSAPLASGVPLWRGAVWLGTGLTDGHVVKWNLLPAGMLANATTSLSRAYLPVMDLGDAARRKAIKAVLVNGEVKSTTGETATVGLQGLDQPPLELTGLTAFPNTGFSTVSCNVNKPEWAYLSTPVHGRYVQPYIEWGAADTFQVSEIRFRYSVGGRA